MVSRRFPKGSRRGGQFAPSAGVKPRKLRKRPPTLHVRTVCAVPEERILSRMARERLPQEIDLTDANGCIHRIREGDIESAGYVLTFGHCHNMAAALHERTGWPIVAFYDFTENSDEDNVKHFAVLSPNGHVVDGDGSITLEEFEARTGMEHERLPDGLPALQEHIDWDSNAHERSWQPLSPDLVKSFVEPILKRHSTDTGEAIPLPKPSR